MRGWNDKPQQSNTLFWFIWLRFKPEKHCVQRETYPEHLFPLSNIMSTLYLPQVQDKWNHIQRRCQLYWPQGKMHEMWNLISHRIRVQAEWIIRFERIEGGMKTHFLFNMIQNSLKWVYVGHSSLKVLHYVWRDNPRTSLRAISYHRISTLKDIYLL